MLGSHAVYPSEQPKCQHACAVIIIPPVFFSPGLFIFLRGGMWGIYHRAGLRFFFFFWPHRSLFYMKEVAERQMAEWRRQRGLADVGAVRSVCVI